MPTGEAVTYRTRHAPESGTFSEAGVAIVRTTFFAETHCEPFIQQPARFGITGVTIALSSNFTGRIYNITVDGIRLEPDEGQLEIAWARTDDLRPTWRAEKVAEVTFERDRRYGEEIDEAPTWFPNPFHMMGNTCPPLAPKLEQDLDDNRRLPLRGAALPRPEYQEPTPAATPMGSASVSLLALALAAAGAFVWTTLRSRRAGE